MIILRLFVGLVIIFLLVAFAIRNMAPVQLDFYFYRTPQVPLFVVIFLCLLLGVAGAWILVIGEQLKMRAELRKRNKKIKELEKQLELYETAKIEADKAEEKEEKIEESGEGENETASQGLQSQGS